MTKKQECMYKAYEQAENFSELWQVYGSFSHAKANALEYCKRLQADKNGYAGKIVSHNGWIFTYGFLYENESGDLCMMYITPSYDYDFKVA